MKQNIKDALKVLRKELNNAERRRQRRVYRGRHDSRIHEQESEWEFITANLDYAIRDARSDFIDIAHIEKTENEILNPPKTNRPAGRNTLKIDSGK